VEALNWQSGDFRKHGDREKCKEQRAGKKYSNYMFWTVEALCKFELVFGDQIKSPRGSIGLDSRSAAPDLECLVISQTTWVNWNQYLSKGNINLHLGLLGGPGLSELRKERTL
jgi:hypothetical protein